MLLRIFEIVSPIIIVVLVGYVYARYKKPDMESANTINIDVFVPMLILSVFASNPIEVTDFGWLIFVGAVVILLPGLFAFFIAPLFKLQRKTFVPPMMFKNSGNLGIPLLLFTFGEEFLPAILILFIIENVLHFSVGIWMLSHGERSFAFLKQPIIISAALGLALSIAHISLPGWMVTALGLMGDVSVPLMLFALGVRLVELDLHGWKVGLLGAIGAPLFGLLAAASVLFWVPLQAHLVDVVWLFATLPPAVLNYLIAERYRQQPDQVAAIVLFSNLGAIFIIPIALYLILL